MSTYIDAQGIEYTYSGSTAYVSSSSSISTPNITIPVAITVASVPYSVTSIGSNAFLNNTVLTSVTISSACTIVSDNAFNGSKLDEIIFANITTITSIGDAAFANTYLLDDTVQTILNSIPTIAQNTTNLFNGCILLNHIVIPSSITNIPSGFFQNCTNLYDITFSNISTITSVGSYAFAGTAVNDDFVYNVLSQITTVAEGLFQNCIFLNNNTIPNTITGMSAFSFNGCTNLTSVTFESVSTIGYIYEYAFSGCSSLTDITIPNSVTFINFNVFSGCTDLTNITLPTNASFTILSFDLFNNCTSLTGVSLPTSVTAIGNTTFYGCSALQQIDISNVTDLGTFIFQNCSSLTNVVLNNSLTSIPQYTFNNCTSLTSVIIPTSVTTLGNLSFFGSGVNNTFVNSLLSRAPPLDFTSSLIFQNCTNITNLSIPSGLTFGSYFLNSCSNLTSITFTGSSTVAISDYMFNDCVKLTSVQFGSAQLVSISVHAFQNCVLLSNISLGTSLTSIGQEVFRGCTSLASITIPDSVTSIEGGTFYECTSLTSVNIPTSITSMPGYFVAGCSTLTNITNFANITGNIGDAAFSRSGLSNTFAQNVLDTFSQGQLGILLFGTCTTVTSITIPSTHTYMGNYFYNCSNLTSITFSTIGNITSIQSLAFLGTGVNGAFVNSILNQFNSSQLGTNLFQNCLNVTSVTIPSSITSLPDNFFDGCANLTSVTFSNINTITTIGSSAFSGTNVSSTFAINLLTTPTITFSGSPFQNCLFTEISIPAALTVNIDYLFYNCDNLTSVTIESGVTAITGNMFRECNNLSSVTFASPNTSFVSIGSGAFYLCNLSTITIPSSVTSIANGALSGNPLTNTTVQTILNSFDQTILNNYTFNDSTILSSVEIPPTYTYINQIFERCPNLSSVTLHNIESINGSAFNNCPELKTIEFPYPTFKNIGGSAFYFSGLTTVSIPNSITTIQSQAFLSCIDLDTAYFYGDFDKTFFNGSQFINESEYPASQKIAYYDPTAKYWSHIITYPLQTQSKSFGAKAGTGSIVPSMPGFIGLFPLGVLPTPTLTSSSPVTSNPRPTFTGTSTPGSTVQLYDNGVAIPGASGLADINGDYSITLPTDLSLGTHSITARSTLGADVSNFSNPFLITITSGPTPTPISDICFPAKTPILTNCGYVNIDEIDPKIHTIRDKKIVAITQTITHDKYLVCIEKDALGKHYPTKTTYISQNHEIFYKGKMVRAKELLKELTKVHAIPYNKEILYNVLLEQHDKMLVNNLICETLHPENYIAKLYHILPNLTEKQTEKLIKDINAKLEKRNIRSSTNGRKLFL